MTESGSGSLILLMDCFQIREPVNDENNRMGILVLPTTVYPQSARCKNQCTKTVEAPLTTDIVS